MPGAETTPQIKNARIVSTHLGKTSGSAFSFSIRLDYGNTALMNDNLRAHRQIIHNIYVGATSGSATAHTLGQNWQGAIPMLAAIIDVVGVDSWEELPGKHVRVIATSEKVTMIGNVIEDKWLDFGAFAKLYELGKEEECQHKTFQWQTPTRKICNCGLDRNLDEGKTRYEISTIPWPVYSSSVVLPKTAHILEMNYGIQTASGEITVIGSDDRLQAYLLLKDAYLKGNKVKDPLYPSPALVGEIIRLFKVLVPEEACQK